MPDTPPPPNRPDLIDNSQKAKDNAERKKLQDRLDKLSEELDKKLSTINPQKPKDSRGNPPFIRHDPKMPGEGGGAGNKGKGKGKGGDDEKGPPDDSNKEGPPAPIKKPDPTGVIEDVPESIPSEIPELPPAPTPVPTPSLKEKTPAVVPGLEDNKLEKRERPTPTPQPSVTPVKPPPVKIILDENKTKSNLYLLCNPEIPCLWIDDGLCPIPDCPILYDWKKKGYPDPNSQEARAYPLCPCEDIQETEKKAIPVKETESEGMELKPTPSPSETGDDSKQGEATPTENTPAPVPQKSTGETIPTKTKEEDAISELERKRGGGGSEKDDGEGEGEGKGGKGWRIGIKQVDIPWTGFGPGGGALPFYIPWIYGPDEMENKSELKHGLGPQDLSTKEQEKLEALRKEQEKIKEEEAYLKEREKFDGIDIPKLKSDLEKSPFGNLKDGEEISFTSKDSEGEELTITQTPRQTTIKFPDGSKLIGGSMTTEDILKSIEDMYNKKLNQKTVPLEKFKIKIDTNKDNKDSENIDSSEKTSASLNQGLNIMSGDLFDAIKSEPLAATTVASTATSQGSNTNINILGGQGGGSVKNSGFSEFINTISNPDTTAQRIMESLEKARVFI